MTVTDQIKILNRKIKQNEVQYDSDRKAKISALPSNNLEKYEYLTGEDLGLQPRTVEQVKLEYSPLGKVFNRGLDEENKKEGLLKRLKNIEDKNEAQLKVIKDQGEKQLEEINNIKTDLKLSKMIDFLSTINEKTKKIMESIKKIDDWLVCTKTDGKMKYDFNNFTFPLKFASKIYRHDLTLQEAKNDQQELEILINKLNNNYNPRNETRIKEKDDTLMSAKKIFFTREEIISAFKKGILPYIDGFQVEKETNEETDKEKDEEIDTTDMPELESKESSAQRRIKEGEGLKILTPNQMPSLLPISLDQLKAGNITEKLENEIWQILYSLCRSKKLTKKIYKSLIDII